MGRNDARMMAEEEGFSTFNFGYPSWTQFLLCQNCLPLYEANRDTARFLYPEPTQEVSGEGNAMGVDHK